MGDKTAVRTREKWADDVKVIACILVVLGHFFQSMTKANILPENDLYEWFETTIYYFLSSVKVAVVGLIVALTAKVLILTGVQRLCSIDSSLKRNLVCARYEYLCV